MTPYEFLMNYLKERDRLEAQATEGKWLNGYPNAGKVTPMPGDIWTSNKNLVADGIDSDDAKFIAHIRNQAKAESEAIRALALGCERARKHLTGYGERADLEVALEQAAKALGWEESK